jgi:hypothetical protein
MRIMKSAYLLHDAGVSTFLFTKRRGPVATTTKRLNTMSKRIISRAITGLTLTLLTTAAFAGEPASIDNSKTTGALALETQGLATDTGAVHRQGGYALPGAVRWLKVPASDERVKQAAAV